MKFERRNGAIVATHGESENEHWRWDGNKEVVRCIPGAEAIELRDQLNELLSPEDHVDGLKEYRDSCKIYKIENDRLKAELAALKSRPATTASGGGGKKPPQTYVDHFRLYTDNGLPDTGINDAGGMILAAPAGGAGSGDGIDYKADCAARGIDKVVTDEQWKKNAKDAKEYLHAMQESEPPKSIMKEPETCYRVGQGINTVRTIPGESVKVIARVDCIVNGHRLKAGESVTISEPPASITKADPAMPVSLVTAPKPSEPLRNRSYNSHVNALRGELERAVTDGDALAGLMREWGM